MTEKLIIQTEPRQVHAAQRNDGAAPAVLTCRGSNFSLIAGFATLTRRDHPMKNEGTREMVLQTTVALLSMGLAVLSLMLMGRWV